MEWGKSNYVNPPYNNIEPFLEKAVEQLEKGRLSVFLIPLKPHTKYWEKYVFPFATEIRFCKRITFEGFIFHFPFQ